MGMFLEIDLDMYLLEGEVYVINLSQKQKQKKHRKKFKVYSIWFSCNLRVRK